MSKLGNTEIGSITLMMQEYVVDLEDAALSSRMHSAMLDNGSSYPICRKLGFAVTVDMEQFFDDLALNLGWNAHRQKVGKLLLDSPGPYAQARGVDRQPH